MSFKAIDRIDEKGNSSFDKPLLYIYILLEGILFFVIKWAEYTQPYRITGKIEYICIILNFCVMAYFYLRYRGDGRVPLALSVTLLADYFLTFLNTHFYCGVFCFIVVQLIYGWKVGYGLRNILLRAGMFCFFSCLMYGLGMNLAFSIFCGCSISLLMGNVICSWILAKRSQAASCFMLAVGLTLFAGCDLSIGFRTLSEGVSALSIFHSVMNYTTWTCYVPSQVLLNLSNILE